MDQKLATVNVTADIFEAWIDKTNVGLSALSNNAVMVVANSTGDSVSGNGNIIGMFSANSLIAGTELRGGTIVASANLVITSNVIFNSGMVINSNALVGAGAVTTSGTSQQLIDSFPLAMFRSGKYVASVKNNSANGYQATELLVIHDGTLIYSTEYATLSSNGVLGTFAVIVNGANGQLMFTP